MTLIMRVLSVMTWVTLGFCAPRSETIATAPIFLIAWAAARLTASELLWRVGTRTILICICCIKFCVAVEEINWSPLLNRPKFAPNISGEVPALAWIVVGFGEGEGVGVGEPCGWGGSTRSLLLSGLGATTIAVGG